MKAIYEVVEPFWHGGVLREPGERLALTEGQARYLITGGNIRVASERAAAPASQEG